MAYKGPEEKEETIISSESTSAGNVKQVSADTGQEDVVGSDKGDQPKAEPNDWKGTTDIYTSKLETQDNGVANGRIDHLVANKVEQCSIDTDK